MFFRMNVLGDFVVRGGSEWGSAPVLASLFDKVARLMA